MIAGQKCRAYVFALLFAIASSTGDEVCRNNSEKEEGGGVGVRERNALPIDYLTHISTSDL